MSTYFEYEMMPHVNNHMLDITKTALLNVICRFIWHFVSCVLFLYTAYIAFHCNVVKIDKTMGWNFILYCMFTMKLDIVDTVVSIFIA